MVTTQSILEKQTRYLVEHMKTEIDRVLLVSALGKVRQVLGTLVEGSVPNASIGELCEIYSHAEPNHSLPSEVVGFTQEATLLSPLKSLEGISSSWMIRPLRRSHSVVVGRHLLGRILDGFGNPLDAGEPLDASMADTCVRQVICAAPTPSERPRIADIFATGVRSIDSVLTLGQGQRVGIFAGPGCGKTTLMAAIARGGQTDVIVLALIGERGREVREFTEHELDPELLKRTVIVCATSDRTSIERVRAAFTATAIAEGLRDLGLNVLLMVDSLTRLARAQREIGLAAGEVPARAGFPPSVYGLLPRLIERAGRTEHGTITAIYTVLLEGELKADPISEEAVSLLDGHIILSRKLAEQGHYPAIDVLPSISRVMSNIANKEHMLAASRLREVLSGYKEIELLVRLGEYRQGVDKKMDQIVASYPKVIAFLRQNTRQSLSWEDCMGQLMALVRETFE